MTERPEEVGIALKKVQDAAFGRANRATRSSLDEDRRMTAAELGPFVTERQYATVATVRPDGRPHAALSAVMVLDGDFWLPTTGGAQRLANVAACPHAVLVLAEGEDEDHAAVTVEGPAAVVPATDVPAGMPGAWRAKFGWWPEWAVAWLRVTPTRVLSYGADGWRATRRTSP